MRPDIDQPRLAVLSFDIEEWFHVIDHPEVADVGQWPLLPSRIERSADTILELLDRHNQQATMFCLGWVADHHPGIIRRLSDAGHEIGCHSYDHRMVHRLNRLEFREDLHRALDTIEQVIGRRVTCYRAPGFSITAAVPWVFEELLRAGIGVDCSLFPGTHAHGGIPHGIPTAPCVIRSGHGELRALPMSTRSIAGLDVATAGGGFFRLLPLTVLQRWLQSQPYSMVYLHPRDLDAEAPIPPGLSPWRRFRTQVGRRSTAQKLDRLLAEVRFFTVKGALQQVDWGTVPVIDWRSSA